MKKFLYVSFVILTLISTGCSNIQEENITLQNEITPFEKAKELIDNYYEYPEIIEELKNIFPDRDILLTESEKKQLFPEQMIGESFPCSAIQTASFFRKFGSTEIEGNLEKGTDKLSIKINDDTISFMTSASLENGETEGEKWNIIRNDDLVLIAQDIGHNSVISTLTISKKTGMGAWQKITASGLPMDYKVPNGLMIYLQCNLP